MLSPAEKAELLDLVSSTDPRNFKLLREKTKNKKVRETLRFYLPMTKSEEAAIWRKRSLIGAELDLPEDEKVEDAGLLDNLGEVSGVSQKSAGIRQVQL